MKYSDDSNDVDRGSRRGRVTRFRSETVMLVTIFAWILALVAISTVNLIWILLELIAPGSVPEWRP